MARGTKRSAAAATVQTVEGTDTACAMFYAIFDAAALSNVKFCQNPRMMLRARCQPRFMHTCMSL